MTLLTKLQQTLSTCFIEFMVLFHATCRRLFQQSTQQCYIFIVLRSAPKSWFTLKCCGVSNFWSRHILKALHEAHKVYLKI